MDMIRPSYYLANSSAKVKLDSYISDLNLEINPEGYSCQPLYKDGFAYMWAGAKANYGIRTGKVCYEVKVAENLDVSTADFTDIYVVRLGWSTDAANLQLGEDTNSYGYGATGKKSEARKFVDYGRRFGKGDVIGCYLSIENGWAEISYCINGRHSGIAYKLRWNSDQALYPHILTKNCRLEINFGQAPNPYFSLQPGFKLIDHIPSELKIPSVQPPNKSQCEVIMMVGLPGVGKSTWASNYAKIHPSKKYNILGTDAIIDKMRVQGLPRKNNFGGRWDILIKQASECFNILLKKASTCNRNLILDQTNVYASARKRKVTQYKDAGYTVNAMVLVPTDEEMMRRSSRRTREEGKEVPQAAVLDMKANFSLPHESENLFDKITFLELQRAEAENLVLQYNADANMKGYKSNRQSGAGANLNQKERNDRSRSGSRQPNMRDSDYRNNERYEDSQKRGDLRYHERESIDDRDRGRSHERRGNTARHWEDGERSSGDEYTRRTGRKQEPQEKYRKEESESRSTSFESSRFSNNLPSHQQSPQDRQRKQVLDPPKPIQRSPLPLNRNPYNNRQPEQLPSVKQEHQFNKTNFGKAPNTSWSAKQEYQEESYQEQNLFKTNPQSQPSRNRPIKNEGYQESSEDRWAEDRRNSGRKDLASDYSLQTHSRHTGFQQERVDEDDYFPDQSEYGNSSMKGNFQMQAKVTGNQMGRSLGQNSGQYQSSEHYTDDYNGEGNFDENWNETTNYLHSEQLENDEGNQQYDDYNQWSEQADYNAENEGWNNQEDSTNWNEPESYYEKELSSNNASLDLPAKTENYQPPRERFNEERGRGRGRNLAINTDNRNYSQSDQTSLNQMQQSGFDHVDYQEKQMQNPPRWQNTNNQQDMPNREFPARPPQHDRFNSNVGLRMPTSGMARLRNPRPQGIRPPNKGTALERSYGSSVQMPNQGGFRHRAPGPSNQRFNMQKNLNPSSVRPRFGQMRMSLPGGPRSARPRMPGQGMGQPQRLRFPNQLEYDDHPTTDADSSISTLTTVDFDKLKASLANLRQAEEMHKPPVGKYSYNDDQEVDEFAHGVDNYKVNYDGANVKYRDSDPGEYSRGRRDKIQDGRSSGPRYPEHSSFDNKSEKYHRSRDGNSPHLQDRQSPADRPRGSRHSEYRDRAHKDNYTSRRERQGRSEGHDREKLERSRSRDVRDQSSRRDKSRESERVWEKNRRDHKEDKDKRASGDFRENNSHSDKYSRRSPSRRHGPGNSRERHSDDNKFERGSTRESSSASSNHRRVHDSSREEMGKASTDKWNQLDATQNLVRKDLGERESSKRLSNQPPSGSPPIKQLRPTIATERFPAMATSNIQQPRMRPPLRGPPMQRGPRPGLLETPPPENFISEEMFMFDNEEDVSLDLLPGPPPRHFFPRPGTHDPQLIRPKRMFGPRGFRGNGMRPGFRPMRPRFAGELGFRRGGPPMRVRLQPDRMMGPRQPRRGLLNRPRGFMRPRMRPPGPPRMRYPI